MLQTRNASTVRRKRGCNVRGLERGVVLDMINRDSIYSLSPEKFTTGTRSPEEHHLKSHDIAIVITRDIHAKDEAAGRRPLPE